MNTTYAPRAATRRAVPREAGFSLLEVFIAGAILVGIITVTAILLQSGNRLLGTTSAQSEADNRAGLVAEQICIRLWDSITVTLTDGAGAPLLDGATVTNGVGAQCFVNFKGGPVGGESYRFDWSEHKEIDAQGIRDDYVGLSDSERDDVLSFLRHL